MIAKKHFEFDAEFKAIGDAGEFEGYGSVFGVVDSYNEVVDKGAFEESLKKHGLPRLLLQHSSWMLGGVYLEAREDEKGLYVKGKLNLDVQAAKEAHSLMKMGAFGGLSIGFRTLQERIDRVTGITHIEKCRLYEVSVVTFPANEAATISAVKSAPGSIRDFEEFLREAGKYSREEAKLIAAKGFRAFETHREGGDQALALDALFGAVDQLRKATMSGTKTS